MDEENFKKLMDEKLIEQEFKELVELEKLNGTDNNGLINNIKIRKITTKDYIKIVLILLVPIILIISSIYFMLNVKKIIGFEKEKPSNSVETSGFFSEYKDCFFDEDENEEFCKAIYKYKVDGKEYSIKTHFSSPKDDHDNEIIVHYDKNNPYDSSIEMIESDFESSMKYILTTSSMVAIGFFITIIIVITIIFIKGKKNRQEYRTNEIN